jgi:hypothetical protein
VKCILLSKVTLFELFRSNQDIWSISFQVTITMRVEVSRKAHLDLTQPLENTVYNGVDSPEHQKLKSVGICTRFPCHSNS